TLTCPLSSFHDSQLAKHQSHGFLPISLLLANLPTSCAKLISFAISPKNRGHTPSPARPIFFPVGCGLSSLLPLLTLLPTSLSQKQGGRGCVVIPASDQQEWQGRPRYAQELMV